jgi:hypothetical protein
MMMVMVMAGNARDLEVRAVVEGAMRESGRVQK